MHFFAIVQILSKQMIKKLTEIKDQYKPQIKQSWTMTLINKSISLLHKCLLKFIICNFWHVCYLKGFWNCFLPADSHLHHFTRVFVMFSCLNSCFYRPSLVFLSFSLLTQGQLQIFREYQISCLSRDIWPFDHILLNKPSIFTLAPGSFSWHRCFFFPFWVMRLFLTQS